MSRQSPSSRTSARMIKAIETLGSGLYAHPENYELREALSDLPSRQSCYHQLLQLCCRLLALRSFEERGCWRGARPLSALLGLGDEWGGATKSGLWRALCSLSHMLDVGDPLIGLPALHGRDALSAPVMLNACSCPDEVVSSALDALLYAGGGPSSADERGLSVISDAYERLLQRGFTQRAVALKVSAPLRAAHRRKRSGSYYTPPMLVSRLLDLSLNPLLERACQRPNPEAELLTLKICDPSCGAGHLLIGVARRVAGRLAALRALRCEQEPVALEREALRDVIERCVYGVDLNPVALELCALWLWSLLGPQAHPLPSLSTHLVCGDALLGAPAEEEWDLGELDEDDAERIKRAARWRVTQLRSSATSQNAPTAPRPFFYWPLAFSEVFQRPSTSARDLERVGGGFDLIVGNPPYLFGEDRPRLPAPLFKLMKGQWDACWLFLELGLRLARDGRLAMVLPDGLLARAEASRARAFVLTRASRVELHHFGESFEASVGVFILSASPGQPALRYVDERADEPQAYVMPDEVRARDLGERWSPPWGLRSPQLSHAPRVADLGTLSRGEELGKRTLKLINARVRARAGEVSVLSGAGVRGLCQQPEATHLAPRAKLRKHERHFRAPKLVIVKTGARLRAGVDRVGLITLQSVYNLQLKESEEGRCLIEFLCAYLVSQAVNRRFIEPFTSAKSVFPQLTQAMILSIPVALPSLMEQEALVEELRCSTAQGSQEGLSAQLEERFEALLRELER